MNRKSIQGQWRKRTGVEWKSSSYTYKKRAEENLMGAILRYGLLSGHFIAN